MMGIKTSYKWKGELYLASRNSNNSILKKIYSKILADVIKEAKTLYYDNQINFPNKIKATDKRINMETHRKASNLAIKSLNTDGRIIINQQYIADTFNSYFLSIADSINVNNKSAHTQNKYNPNIVSNNSPLQFMSQIHKST
jgi:hypothetical protein